MADEMLGFEEAMKRLQLSEQELQNLVASGTLRAFRSGGQMKFKAADLEAVKKERATEPTIIIPAAGIEAAAGTPELKVEMPADLVVDESAQTVVGRSGGSSDGVSPTVAIPEHGTEELVFDDKELEVLPLEDEAAGTQTAGEAATVVESTEGTPGEITVAEEGGVEGAPAKPSSSRRPGLSSRVGQSISRRRSAAFEVRKGNPIMAVVLGVTAAVCIFTLSIYGVWLARGYRAGNPPTDSIYVAGYLKGLYDWSSKLGEPKP